MTNEISMRTFSVSNAPIDAEDGEYAVNPSVVGIGRKGIELVRALSSAPLRLTCHEVSARPEGGNGESPAALAARLGQDYLVFFVAGTPDDSDVEILRFLAKTSRNIDSWPLLVGIASDGLEGTSVFDELLDEDIGLDTLFLLNTEMGCFEDKTLPISAGARTTFETLARHLITVLTRLNQQRSVICVDFSDVALILRSGKIGRMGIGVASGDDCLETASRLALNVVKDQLEEKAVGGLGILCARRDLSAEDFHLFSEVLYPHIPDDSPFIMGLVHDTCMGGRAEATVLSIEKQ